MTLVHSGQEAVIPTGVYYSEGNFYDCQSRRGMGDDFYYRWVDRRDEFPVRPEQ